MLLDAEILTLDEEFEKDGVVLVVVADVLLLQAHEITTRGE